MSDEETSCVLDRARAIRGGHQGVITKLVHKAEEIVTTATVSLDASSRNRLNVIKQRLYGKLSILDEMNKDILGCCDAAVIVTEIEESDAIVTKVISCKLKIDEFLAITSSHTSTPLPTTSATSPTIPVITSKIHLPKLTLPKFNGHVTKWNTFWDFFKSAINENPQLATIDKFNCLYSLLEGSAFLCVKGLPLSEDNYDMALDVLKQRFGRKQTIICVHMDELVKLPNCTNDRPHSLCSLYDQITVHIRVLKTLEINPEQYGSLLISTLMSKLPSKVRLRIAWESREDVWKIKDLMKVVQTEVEAREASKNTKFKPTAQLDSRNHSHGGRNHTASAFVSQNHHI